MQKRNILQYIRTYQNIITSSFHMPLIEWYKFYLFVFHNLSSVFVLMIICYSWLYLIESICGAHMELIYLSGVLAAIKIIC